MKSTRIIKEVNSIKKIVDIINSSNDIYIASHINPDGDNIGSILALGLALRKINKDVHIFKTDDIPSDYLFLPEVNTIKEYDVEDIELFLVLDCSDIDRLGKYKCLLDKSKYVINIDHHISNTFFGDCNLVDDKSAATGELVYELIVRLGIDIDKEIADCLYTAISTDTGSFMYSSVTYKTHEIISKLIESGVEVGKININLYQSRSVERTNLFINSINTIKYYNDNKITSIKVTQDMLSKVNAKMEDTEGIISFIRDIKGVEVACLLKEYNKNEIKVSLRSKEIVNVSEICAAFNGGGHIRAAGCTINKNIDDAERLIIEKIMSLW